MNVRAYVLIPLLCAVPSLMAQLQEGDTSSVRVLASLSGILQSGNVDYRAVRGRIEWVVRPLDPLVWKSQNTSLYQEFFGRRSDNDVFSRNFIYYHPDRDVYPFLIAYVSANHRRKLDLRYFYGAGMTLRMFGSDTRTMKASVGLIHERSRFTRTSFRDAQYDGQMSVSLYRATIWAGGSERPFGDELVLTYDAYWQPSFSRQRNFRWQTEVGAELRLARRTSITMQYLVSYEHLVVTSVSRGDALMLVGLSLLFDQP